MSIFRVLIRYGPLLIESVLETEKDVILSDHITTDEDMMNCLRQKYKIQKYKKLLLKTNKSILHEKPMRGKGNDWTSPGKDKLGKMLMKIKNEIKNI